MKFSTGTSANKTSVPQDLVSIALEANAAHEEMLQAGLECAEIEVCLENLSFVNGVVKDHGLEGLKTIDIDGSIESFLGNVANAEAAIEGLGQKIKDGFTKVIDKIKEWITKFINWIKDILGLKKKAAEKQAEKIEQTKVVDDYIKREASSGAKEVPAEKVPAPVKKAVEAIAPKMFKSSGVLALPHYKSVEEYYNEAMIKTPPKDYSLIAMINGFDTATKQIQTGMGQFEKYEIDNVVKLVNIGDFDSLLDHVGKAAGLTHESSLEEFKAALKQLNSSTYNKMRDVVAKIYYVDIGNGEMDEHPVSSLCPFNRLQDVCSRAKKIHAEMFDGLAIYPDIMDKFYDCLDACKDKLNKEIKESKDPQWGSKLRIVIEILHTMMKGHQTCENMLFRIANSVELSYRQVNSCHCEAIRQADSAKAV